MGGTIFQYTMPEGNRFPLYSCSGDQIETINAHQSYSREGSEFLQTYIHM